MKSIARNCPNCQSEQHTVLPKYSVDDWTTVQCNACDFIFLNRAPVYEALSEDLAWSKQFEKEAKRRKKETPIVSWIDRKTRWRLHIMRDNEWEYICDKVKGGNVLDIGCGPINRIPEQYTPFGIEIEKEAAEVAQKAMGAKGGRVVHAPALKGLSEFDNNMFDGIIMRSYLEHELQPKEVLDEALRVLKPGGSIYAKVPNFATINRAVRGRNWCGFRFPDHLNYFTIESMKEMGEGSGYDFDLRNTFTRWTNDNLHCYLTKPAA